MPKRKDHDESTPQGWADDISSTEQEQVSMRTVWAMYAEVLKGKNGEGGQDSIYDLVRRVTATAEEADAPQFHNISPLVALARAKDAFSHLSAAEQEASPQHNAQWRWSPQSTKAGKQLAKLYGDKDWDVDDLLSDYENAFGAGWRWFPSPSVKTKSHDHKFYPPKDMLPKVQAWQLAANKAQRTDKTGLAAGTIYLSSPETISFLEWNAPSSADSLCSTSNNESSVTGSERQQTTQTGKTNVKKVRAGKEDEP